MCQGRDGGTVGIDVGVSFGWTSARLDALRVMAWLRTNLLLLCMLLACGRAPAPVDAAGSAGEVLGLEESFESVPGFEGQVYVLTAGPRDAQPLVLIHGMGDQGARDFAPILPALSARFRVLTFDLPGLARSAQVRGSYTPVDYARLIRALIERHLEQPVFLLGHSMGGALALEVAADMQEQVSRLALLDVAGVLYQREYLREVVLGTEAEADPARKAWRGTKRLFLKLGMAPMPDQPLEQAAIEANPLLKTFFSQSSVIALLFLQHDFGPALRKVRAPTWLGWGAKDSIAPKRTAELLRVALRPRDDVLFLQSGHVPMRTESARLSESLLAFFGREPHRLQPAKEAPVSEVHRALRHGSCVNRRRQVFEGDYDSISILRCKQVVLRNVRARSLRMEQSNAELRDVSFSSSGVAVSLKRARLKWTGGSIDAGTCFDTERSVVDLAAVNCRYRDEPIHVRGPHTLRANVSELANAQQALPLHGEYRLLGPGQGAALALRFERLEWQEQASVEPELDAEPKLDAQPEAP